MAGPFKDGSAFYIQYIDIKNGRGQGYTKNHNLYVPARGRPTKRKKG